MTAISKAWLCIRACVGRKDIKVEDRHIITALDDVDRRVQDLEKADMPEDFPVMPIVYAPPTLPTIITVPGPWRLGSDKPSQDERCGRMEVAYAVSGVVFLCRYGLTMIETHHPFGYTTPTAIETWVDERGDALPFPDFWRLSRTTPH